MRAWFLVLLLLESAFAQQQTTVIAPIRPHAPIIVRPYKPVEVPPVRLANSPRLAELVRAGALYLTAQDAVALALENNIDIEIARYNPIIATWNLERSEAGGALPGVPNAASQAGTVAAGQGVAGSQAAAGVRINGAAQNGGQTANATISQIGPVTQTLDPIIQESSTFSHVSQPQANVVQSLIINLISNTRAHAASYQQGFLSGGSVTVRYTDNYLNENSPTDLLNPSSAPRLSVSAQQNLLRGFGVAVNARTITVSKMNVNTSDLNFRSIVIAVVAQVLNQYYSLASAYEDLKAKQNTADTAATFLKNTNREIELGRLAPPDAITAENQAIISRQAVVDADAALRQAENRLKNLLSRNGTADPVLAAVRIVPLDKMSLPASDNLPSIEDMVRQALANRTDLASERAGLRASEVSGLGTRNGVLPTGVVFGSMTNAGLAGTPRTVVDSNGRIQTPDPYFVGGIGTALGQVFRRNFPTTQGGFFFQATLNNNQAQADFAIDQLSLRQSQLTTQRDLNRVQVDLLNNVIALQQARARYEAAVQNQRLQQELFEGEQKKFQAGASTAYDVIQQQRDLTTSQATQISALTTYTTARIALDQTLGTILEANKIQLK